MRIKIGIDKITHGSNKKLNFLKGNPFSELPDKIAKNKDV
jgi:hypothetical protein